jgi:lipoic acid synthetase
MKVKMPVGKEYARVKNIVKKYKLHTICTSGLCPNIGECWGNGTATFMILGDVCTRSCRFCNVKTGKPGPVDMDEPHRLAQSVKLMKLKHCVITSVDRDDLKDGGASFWVLVIETLRKEIPSLTMETLIPDFSGRKEDIHKVIMAKPDVISHNLETVERLTPLVRNKSIYRRSLEVIKQVSESGIVSKSGIMLGLGETEDEIFQTMDDLLDVGCKVITLGQYLRPSENNIEVQEFIRPERFICYEEVAKEKGFRFVESNPLVRSSYHAEKHVNK